MGVSQFPEIDFPVVSITIIREAAPPDIMDGDVTDVVEDAVAGVESVNYIMSRSLEGTSNAGDVGMVAGELHQHEAAGIPCRPRTFCRDPSDGGWPSRR